MFVMFYICYKSKKEYTTWNDNSGMRVLHNFHSLLQYIVSVTYTKFLYMDMTIALKSLNAANSQYTFNHYTTWHYSYIRYLLQMYYYLM